MCSSDLVRERLKMRGISYPELRVDYIGMSSLHGMGNPPGKDRPEPYEVRLRMAARSPDRKTAEALMASLGQTLWLSDEALMDAVTAVSGSGPAYVFLLAEAFAEAARAQGLDPATADTLARATVTGAGALLAADSRSAETLRQEVTSPGGTTEAALTVLTASGGLMELFQKAIAAATERGRELGKQ